VDCFVPRSRRMTGRWTGCMNVLFSVRATESSVISSHRMTAHGLHFATV
jgi:hypothetical protein